MEAKKFYKSTKDKMLGGVCGGIGEYLDFDSTIIRLLLVLLAISSSGVVLIAYIIVCLIIPYNPIHIYGEDFMKDAVNKEEKEENIFTKKKIGYFIIFFGFVLYINNLIPNFISGYFIPICCLIGGITLIATSYDKGKDTNNNFYYEEEEEYTTSTINKEEDKESNEVLNEVEVEIEETSETLDEEILEVAEAETEAETEETRESINEEADVKSQKENINE